MATQRTPTPSATPCAAVVLCDCGGTLTKLLNIDRLAEEAKKLDGVTSVKRCSAFCKGDCAKVLKQVSRTRADRVLVAACTRAAYAPVLDPALAEAKINEALSSSVNIREGCAWVHSGKRAATAKASAMLRASLRRLLHATPIKQRRVKAEQSVAVYGADLAGMQAAASLAALGHTVTLFHDERLLGGMAVRHPELSAHLGNTPSEASASVAHTLGDLLHTIGSSKNITVIPQANLTSITGEAGDFTVKLDTPHGPRLITAGAAVLTAAQPSEDADVRWGPVTSVAGLMESRDEGRRFERVAFVLDGASQHDRAVTAEVLSAAEMLLADRSGVTLFAEHLRVATDGVEQLYRRVREAGLAVIKTDTPPVLLEADRYATLQWSDLVLGGEMTGEFDMVVEPAMPTGVHPIAQVTEGLRAGPAGSLQVDDVWMLPTASNRPGIFVAGAARGQSEFASALADGLTAAGAAHALLAGKRVEITEDAPVVDAEKCVLCLTCKRICPSGAVRHDVEAEAAAMSPVSCLRCGACAAECPGGAIQLPRFTDEELDAELAEPSSTVIFACENSAGPAADAAGAQRMAYDDATRLVPVPCAGKVDARDILHALEDGAAKVLVVGCHPESCQYLSGATRARERIARLRRQLQEAGVDAERVGFAGLASVEPRRLVELL